MPIQWSGPLTDPEKLASIIQGEAGSPEGQFGVAAVMANRLKAGSKGGFGDTLQDIVQPSQFNGYNVKPSPYAQQLAHELWTQGAPQGGSTGNALYFAAPDPTNASWANPGTAEGKGLFSHGVNLGGNYYTDRLGAPTGKLIPPSMGTTINSVPMDPSILAHGGVAPTAPAAPAVDPSIAERLANGDIKGALEKLTGNKKDANGNEKPGSSALDKLAGLAKPKEGAQQQQSAPMLAAPDMNTSIAPAAQQLFSATMANAAKPLSWSAVNPYGFDAGPQGLTLNSGGPIV